MHYVILGNGVCGTEAALSLRKRDEGARITLISHEHDHLFSRPTLMYLFCGQVSLRGAEPYDRGLYERMGFTRVRERVTALDSEGRTLRLEGGGSVQYDLQQFLCVESEYGPAVGMKVSNFRQCAIDLLRAGNIWDEND